MTVSFVENVAITGICTAVPSVVSSWRDEIPVFGESDLRKIVENTGVENRRVAPPGVCTSDLCVAAAERLLGEMGLGIEAIDAIILVTQTPDYVLPATACSIAGRLGAAPHCVAFDVNLGCSGYTHGLWLASHLVAGRALNRVLLLAGDIATHRVFPRDRSARMLFGDAGTATIIEGRANPDRIRFRLGTDGTGQNSLIVPAGGFRRPSSTETSIATLWEDGNERGLDHLFMNGADVFSFTIRSVPRLLMDAISDADWTVADVDYFVLHQANAFMLKFLAKSAGIPLSKLPIALKDFGNTSSASIPLALTTALRDQLSGAGAKPLNLVLAGFGVGFSWSAVATRLDGVVMPPLVEVDPDVVLRRLSTVSTTHLPPCLLR
jgi:3-oxoacyl-[acyl-carrier-protein] synthase III